MGNYHFGVFGICKGFKEDVRTCTFQEFSWMVHDEKVQEKATACADAYGKYWNAKSGLIDPKELDALKDAYSAIKKGLPFITPMATFKDGKRNNKNAIPSGLNYLDVDGLYSPEATYNTVKDMPAMDRVLAAHMTPSKHGLRLIFVNPEGMSIMDGQAWMAEQLGVENYDQSTKDFARASFVVPESYFFKLDKQLFEGDPEYVANVPENKPATSVPAVIKTQVGAAGAVGAVGALVESVLPYSTVVRNAEMFKSLLYADIIKALLDILGIDKQPAEGERNNCLYAVARQIRYICDFNVEKMMDVIPDWGLPEGERRNTITSAVNSTRSKDMPRELRAAISKVEMDTFKDDVDAIDTHSLEKLPKLPKFLKKLLASYPEHQRTTVFFSALHCLGVLLGRVRAFDRDGRTSYPLLNVCIVGPSAAGKSSMEDVCHLLLKPLKDEDAKQRNLEAIYKENKEKAKNDKKQPEKPETKIRLIPASTSNAIILKRAKAVEGLALSLSCTELDSLVKSEKAGSWSEKSDMFRTGFNGEEWGQDYASDNSFSGIVKLLLGFIASGTYHAVSRYFKDVENGLVTRVCFVRLPAMRGQLPPRTSRNAKKKIEDYIIEEVTRLYNDNNAEVYEELKDKEGNPVKDENGDIIMIPKVYSEENKEDFEDWIPENVNNKILDALDEWQLEKIAIYNLDKENVAIDIFRRRCGVFGLRAAMIMYVLNGRKLNKMVIDVALWVAEFTLQQLLTLFGKKVNKIEKDDVEILEEAETYVKNNSTLNILARMPEVFTKSELLAEVQKTKPETEKVDYLVSRWSQRGYVKRVDDTHWQKVA